MNQQALRRVDGDGEMSSNDSAENSFFVDEVINMQRNPGVATDY